MNWFPSRKSFVVLCSLTLGLACDSNPPPSAQLEEANSSASSTADLAAPQLPEDLAPTGSAPTNPAPDAGIQEEEEKPWPGPFFAITRSSSGIYSEPVFSRSKKIGYVQEGGQVAVYEERVKSKECSGGWYKLVKGGYMCNQHGTTNLDSPKVKFGPKRPDLDAVLPFRYARNVANGTPLYKSVPTKEQVERYEPYLKKAEDKQERVKKTDTAANGDTAAKRGLTATEPAKATTEEQKRAREEQLRRMKALEAARRSMLENPVETPVAIPAPKPEPVKAIVDAGSSDKKWWQQEDPKLHELSTSDLTREGDDVLSRRMVKGFYIAIDRQFRWNKRRWFRSIKGEIAPADRLALTSGSKFTGVELDATWQLPVGWVYGWKKSRPKYTIDVETKKLKIAGNIKRFTALNLTGEEIKIRKHAYVKSHDGFWMRKSHVRMTQPGPVPEEVKPGEPWVDVNLNMQTVVLFRGHEAVFATLTSTGKRHRMKEKDHRTPTGQWRIQTKHVTTTMDGDGTAAGDLPYSIQGVPYAMYFHKSYALHGAFWHRNYGMRMSHGCVNLAPLDAKFIFFQTNPPVHEGWHGAWSSEQQLGSLVVVHD